MPVNITLPSSKPLSKRFVPKPYALIYAFCDAVKTVTPENVLNTFKHCGYRVEH